MYITKSDLEIIKQYPIIDYLFSIGLQPAGQTGNQILYFSPLANENTASFFVEPKKNVFNDFSTGEKGDVIRLIQLIEQVPFIEAVKRLEGLKTIIAPSFSFSGNTQNTTESKIEVIKVQSIQSKGLIDYIVQRGINIELARMYCKEVHFINQGKSYFAVGFQNQSGGYELRNGLGYKGKTDNGITVFEKGTNQVNLFEGFFDFLSALQYFHSTTLNNTTIILNTNNNLKCVVNYITDKSLTINAFLDNDKSGKSAVNQLIKHGFTLINQSEKIYPNSKDFNDFLLVKSMKTD
jgi:DNA primase